MWQVPYNACKALTHIVLHATDGVARCDRAAVAGNRWCLKKRMDRAKNSVRPRRWRPRARQQVRPLERGLKKSRSHLQRRGGGDRLLGNCEGGEFGKALPREYARGDMCHLVRRGVRGRKTRLRSMGAIARRAGAALENVRCPDHLSPGARSAFARLGPSHKECQGQWSEHGLLGGSGLGSKGSH